MKNFDGRVRLSLVAFIGILGFACGDDPPEDGAAGGSGSAGTSGAGGGGAGAGGDAAGGTPSEAGAAGTMAEGGAAGSAGTPTYECAGPGALLATSVVEHEFGSGQDHGQDTFPEPVLGPPSGGGCCMGSLEVTSLGVGGFVVLAFENNVIVDGPGPDFMVFENAFLVDDSDPSTVFAEIGTVSVSQDGETWTEYACSATEYPFEGCAGWHPVLANALSNQIDARDPQVAGGDGFDLASIGVAWARYVKIQDRTVPDDAMATFDLDAVSIVNAGCP